MNLLALALAWLLWCLLHSLLIHPPVENRLRRLLGDWEDYYRLLYNLFALVSLVPVGFIFWLADNTSVLVWPLWLRPLQWVCWLAAVSLFFTAGRVYHLPDFFGVRQVQGKNEKKATSGSSNDGGLRTTGVLRFSRHPWYLAGLILLWSRNLTMRDLVTSVLLTLYLLIGMMLEERKLVQKFGREYREYQRQVPLLWKFFPKSKP